MTRCGLPHSEIPGSKLICSSPGLIAACHVLHRLLAPRHSPYTLSSLTIRNSKLTVTDLFACQVGLGQFHETLHVFVVGKNYRLQNIQLSKITHDLDAKAPKPPVRSLVGPNTPLRFLAELSRNTEVARNLFTSAAGWVRYQYCSAHC